MRIISQKGTDYPYDNFIVQQYEEDIYLESPYVNSYSVILGHYSSEEEALKVMEMIREKYFEEDVYFHMPQDNEVKENVSPTNSSFERLGLTRRKVIK